MRPIAAGAVAAAAAATVLVTVVFGCGVASAATLVATRCGGFDVVEAAGDGGDTEVKQNECPRYACPASLAAANPGNARDLPFAVCNLDALGVDGKVAQPAAKDDGSAGELPDKVAAGDGHAFCATGEDAGAIVQEQCALHDWLAGGETALVVRLTHAVRAAVVCVVSLDKRDAAASHVRFTTSGSGGSASWTASTTNGRQCFALIATAFDTLRIENGDDASTDGLCVQRIETACGGDAGASCTRDYGESNPPPVAKTSAGPKPFCPAGCVAGGEATSGTVSQAAVGLCTTPLFGACGSTDAVCTDGLCDEQDETGVCAPDGSCCGIRDAEATCCGDEANCVHVATGNRPPLCALRDATVDSIASDDCLSSSSIGQPCSARRGGDAVGRCAGFSTGMAGPFVLFLCIDTDTIALMDSFEPCGVTADMQE